MSLGLTTTKNSKYIPVIDGLRAVAILLVIGFHYFPQKFRGGFIGVDVFFVISGFLITRIILENKENTKKFLFIFYMRRIRRLYPALLTSLAFCSVIFYLLYFPNENLRLSKAIIAAIFFYSNFNNLTISEYFDPIAIHQPFLHLWSLAIEEQFYLIWPLLLLISGKKEKRKKIIIIFTFIFFLINIKYLICGIDAYYFPWVRFWELSAGGLISISKIEISRKKIINIYGNLGILVIISASLTLDKDNFPGIKCVVPILGALLVIFSCTQKDSTFKWLGNKLFVFIGKISYPLYLFHWPILSILNLLYENHGGLTRSLKIMGILISFLLSILTYRFVEIPIRNKLSLTVSVKRLVSLALLISIFGGTLQFEGISHRLVKLDPKSAIKLVQNYPHPQKNSECQTRFPDLYDEFWACLLSNNSDPDLLLIGDSHANQYFTALQKFYPARSILNLSEPGCLPFVGQDNISKKCSRINLILDNFLVSQTQLKQVIVAGYFGFLVNLEWSDERNRIPAKPNHQQLSTFSKNGISFLRKFEDKGIQISIIEDIPSLGIHPLRCVKISPDYVGIIRSSGIHHSFDTNCGFPVLEWDKSNLAILESLTSVAQATNALLLNPATKLCNVKRCFLFSGEEPLYYDTDHLTKFGANMIIQALFSNID